MDRILHTPEGVRDIYNSECKKKIMLQEALLSVLRSFGCDDIETPTFEYYDIFSDERGTVKSKAMYKFFDREGNTLVLRPDITPAIARCVAKYYNDETLPLRLCYCGNTYINDFEYQGKMKESTQCGAELINDSSVEADAEMLAMTIECMLASGLTEFLVEVGEVNFFKGLVEEADFNSEEIKELRDLIENKNRFGIESFLETKDIPSDSKQMLMRFPELFGNVEKLYAIKESVKNTRAREAVERLLKLFSIMKDYGYEKYITFDLGMLSKYEYYTGVIFNGYTYGNGNTVASGGRYDKLLMQFGKDTPAIGVGIKVDRLMSALESRKLISEPEDLTNLIIYDELGESLAHVFTKKLHAEGLRTRAFKYDAAKVPEYGEHIRKNNIKRVFLLVNRPGDFRKEAGLDEGVEICGI